MSIIMPTYRRAHHVGATLRSLLSGLWTNFELLVRDDGDGADGTAEAVAEAARGDSRVRYHHNPSRLGMPENLNSGIRDSRGELIAVCHDHDIYKASFLAQMVNLLDRYPTVLFVHCAIEIIGQDGRFRKNHIGRWPERTAGNAWLQFMLDSLNCPVCALTVVRREAHEQYGLYDPAYGFIADVEMWMRLSLYGDVAYVAEPLVEVRERESDHFLSSDGMMLLRKLAGIHRRYVSLSYSGLKRIVHRMRMELRVSRRYVRLISCGLARQLLCRNKRTQRSGTSNTHVLVR